MGVLWVWMFYVFSRPVGVAYLLVQSLTDSYVVFMQADSTAYGAVVEVATVTTVLSLTHHTEVERFVASAIPQAVHVETYGGECQHTCLCVCVSVCVHVSVCMCVDVFVYICLCVCV